MLQLLPNHSRSPGIIGEHMFSSDSDIYLLNSSNVCFKETHPLLQLCNDNHCATHTGRFVQQLCVAARRRLQFHRATVVGIVHRRSYALARLSCISSFEVLFVRVRALSSSSIAARGGTTCQHSNDASASIDESILTLFGNECTDATATSTAFGSRKRLSSSLEEQERTRILT